MSLEEIRPTDRALVMDMVREAGVDVTDWSNGKRGAEGAASNPKYCYEWAFLQPRMIAVLNLWHAEMEEDAGVVTSRINLRKHIMREEGARRKARANSMDRIIQTAFRESLPIRVIVLAGKRREIDEGVRVSQASKRLLDPVPWVVHLYDDHTGECVLVRGGQTPTAAASSDDEFEGFEGEVRQRFARHRTRESRLRRAKLDEAKKRNDGRLKCEVPFCGFDFGERYGAIGEDYAHVHHLEPLSDAPDTGRTVTLDQLAVVCANCHAMIHVGGQCRELDDLIPPPR
jgi:5-methylcytosine-specific restriction enzyme A